jgi:hypothetical protein
MRLNLCLIWSASQIEPGSPAPLADYRATADLAAQSTLAASVLGLFRLRNAGDVRARGIHLAHRRGKPASNMFGRFFQRKFVCGHA